MQRFADDMQRFADVPSTCPAQGIDGRTKSDSVLVKVATVIVAASEWAELHTAMAVLLLVQLILLVSDHLVRLMALQAPLEKDRTV